MKRILGLGIAFSVVMVPSSAKAEWVYAASAQGVDFLIEDSSVVNQGNTVRFWLQDVWVRPYRGQAKRVISHLVVDCSSSMETTLSSTAYSKSGRPLSNPALSPRPGYQRVNLPGSAGYLIQQTVCGN